MNSLSINLEQAIHRGAYIKALSCVEASGIPLDMETILRMKRSWGQLVLRLVGDVDAEYGVYEGTSFKTKKFSQYLNRTGKSWPKDSESGKLLLDEETFKSRAAVDPDLENLRQLRKTLSQARELKLEIGNDGRNRTNLSPFKSVTGRNQPSTTKFSFGPARWFRSLIKPGPGRALAYIDWSQQEFGIAAALSGDLNMLLAYQSGDPYLEFAKQAKAVPMDATKKTHPAERDLYKGCVLAVQYQMGVDALAAKLKMIPFEAKKLLDSHKKTFSAFWRYSDQVFTFSKLHGFLESAFGWRLTLSPETKERTIRNFPMQANGAEMLRRACIRLYESGITVCATIHDAILIEAPLDSIEEAVKIAQRCMEEASLDVLQTLRLRSDAKIVRYPDRFEDGGKNMWNRVMGILEQIEAEEVKHAQK